MASFSLFRTAVLMASVGALFRHNFVLANPNPDAIAVCKTLEQEYPQQVADSAFERNLTLGFNYKQTRRDYWSLANGDIKPACIFFAGSAEEISFAVKTLNQHVNAPWAIKGAGHNPNIGFSSTQGGVLIATNENMAYTTLDSNNLAHVGAGARWIDVADALDPFGRAVVSGRVGVVGAAGLSLGGGLSFLGVEHGMTADNIVEFKVVLADGTITTASKTQNSDIWYALKGGGNQFAIVTEFVMQTYPIGLVWGGTKIYTLDKKDAILKATQNLVSDYYDPKAAVIVTFSTTLDSLVDIFVVFFFYNGPERGEILREFDSIPALLDTTKSGQRYRDILNANSALSLEGMRYLIRTETIPNLPGDAGADVYNHTFESYFKAAKVNQLREVDNYIYSIGFQPIPHQMAQNSVSNPNGVNLLGLDRKHGDKIFMTYNVSWLFRRTDPRAASTITAMTAPASEYVREKYGDVPPTNYISGDLSFAQSRPLFMNDAMFNQDPLKSYPSDVYSRLQQIQRQRDPNGFFSKRTGGFKL